MKMAEINNTDKEALLALVEKYTDLDSLLDYYGEYWLCYEELGKQVQISKEEFDLFSLVLPIWKAEE